MKSPEIDDLEVVGFNGQPLVECGRALPVARRKSDGMHCVLRLRPSGSALNWHAADEAAAHAAAHRWTMLAKPVGLPRSCHPEPGRAVASPPMVVFADESMLDMADRLPRPPAPGGEYLIWRRLQGRPENIQAACASAETVEKVLDEWASALLKRFDAMHGVGRDREYLKRIADFALCAANARLLRWKSYLRYASVQDVDHVRRTFERFTHREFPDVTWEAFIRDLKSLRDVLGAAPPPASQPAPVSSPSAVMPKLHGIAAAAPIEVDGRLHQ